MTRTPVHAARAGAGAVAVALAVVWPALGARAAHADTVRDRDARPERVSLSLRGGGFDREDGGYADHAGVFGLGNPEVAGGGVIEAGVRVFSRLWLLGSWSGFTSSATRRLDSLTVTNQAVLLQLGVTAWRGDYITSGEPWSVRIDLTAGGGLYTLSDDLAGHGRTDRAAGLRAGLAVTAWWRDIGATLAYGRHQSRAHLDDRLGGSLGASGNEWSGGLALRF